MEKIGPYLINSIITGNAKELSQFIPEKSIDGIFTDPVYENKEDYYWLADVTKKLLRPGGVLLCWSNGKWHYRNTKWLEDAGLKYRWTFTHINQDTSCALNGRIISKANRVIYFDIHGDSKLKEYVPDGYATYGSKTSIGRVRFKWYKSAPYTKMLLRGFFSKGSLIFDPFSGSAVTAASCIQMQMNYLAFEIDPEVAEIGRERVRITQPPLPLTFEAHQSEMFGEVV